ncbi:MAG: rubrerythrin family protein [Clostridia bacterium]|nr:rubrerythrin family protein [Clostridia bacterium]
MQFNQTQTFLNLARAFAGESQAGIRYQMIAQQATAQGYKTLADTIRSIAKNETHHARIFFDYLIKYAGSHDNINIDAGYPFHAGDLQENLRFAAQDEAEEQKRIYPTFAKIAKEEGFDDIARSFTQIANIESHHNTVFSYLHEAVKNGTLYKNKTPILWVCSECGYMHTSEEAWNICPVCHHSQGHVELHIPFNKEKLS